MSSQQQGSQKLRRNVSPAGKTSGPLRATLPVSFMIHSEAASPTPAASKSSSSTRGRASSNRARQSPWRIRQWSPTPKVEESSEAPDTASINRTATIRRTASLDAIYAKGLWPRGNYSQFGSHLLVDKWTQTPDEWAQLDDWRYPHRGMEASPSRDLKQKQRLCLPVHQYSVSPSRVVASTNTEAQSAVVSQAIPVPSRLVPSRIRNSVEGFSTEVEKFIWTNQETCAAKINEPTPDGHRAPIAELFRCSSSPFKQRSVNTQTPVAAPGSTHSSSGNSSPLSSVSPLLWSDPWQSRPSSETVSGAAADSSSIRMATGLGDADQLHSLSPEVFHEFQGLSLCGGSGGGAGSVLGTSPGVSRFLCREPPDGCEKVPLKAVEQSYRLVQDLPSVGYGPPKPSSQFVLQPSSSSAFCPLPPYNKAAAFNQDCASPPLRPLVQSLPPGSDHNELA